MAQITINPISSNYSISITNSSYCTVALPITASWGPAFEDLESTGKTLDEALEDTVWTRFPATQTGLESFVSTYRGASSNYRRTKDYSYQIALSLLANGYDVLTCRLCPGTRSTGEFSVDDSSNSSASNADSLVVEAKYPGTFGNNLLVSIKKVSTFGLKYWNAIVYAVDASNVRTSLENINFVFDIDNSTDSILHISEITSDYITFKNYTNLNEDSVLVGDPTYGTSAATIRLANGDDTFSTDASTTAATLLADATTYAKDRFGLVTEDPDSCDYIRILSSGTITDKNVAAAIKYREWTFTYATKVLDLIKDKLTYNPNRVISPWDDQNFYELGLTEPMARFGTLSPMHVKLMDVAYFSRCATALLDIPKSLARSGVWVDEEDATKEGYTQKLARYLPDNSSINTGLYTSSSALFAPWGQYTYVGTSKQAPASPSFLALMITRQMILNQPNQYEWALPTVRSTNFKLGKLDYTIPEDLLNNWQSREGCRVNVITTLPELGACVWGNSTLFEVPPATYQALANLSTRYIFNAIQDVVYRVGIGITYQYSNANAYDRFYAGVTPILDTMSNVGALVKGADVPGRDDLNDPGYYVTMAADINGLDSVNANSVIGKIVIRTAGVIEDITIDLIALPQSAALTTV
jgi:hypothetical protein